MNMRQWIAAGLLGLGVLALVVGALYQERQLAAKPATDESVSVAEKASSLAKAIGPLRGSYLAQIHLSGPIEMKVSDSMIGDKDSNAVKVRKALDEVAKDDKVKGVLLEINSPGGTVGMSQELHAAVVRVREKKPVVVHFGDMAASGGYYTAVAADRIVSNPGTLTASIGVIISGLNFKTLMNDKLGVKAITIKSGKHKDMLSPYREPTESDLALLQEIIDISYQQFLNVVLEGRTKHLTDQAQIALAKEKLRAVADGRVINGEQALKAGVVDVLGDSWVAHGELDALAKEKFGIESADRLPLEVYQLQGGLLSGIMLPFQMNGSSPAQWLSHVVAPLSGAGTSVPAGVGLPMSARYPNQPLWVME